MTHIPIETRRKSLENLRLRELEAYYRASKRLQEAEKNLENIDYQLTVMTGLVDPTPEAPNGTE